MPVNLSAWGERPRLIASTLPAPPSAPLTLLSLSPHAPRVLWKPPAPAATYVGIGQAVALTATGVSRFARLQLRIADLADGAVLDGDPPRAAQPRFFGGFGFNANPIHDPAWAGFPSALLILPRYLFTFTPEGAWLTVSDRVNSDREADAELARLRADGAALLAALSSAQPPTSSQHTVSVVPRTDPERWHEMVTTVTAKIKRRELKKAVLARAVDVAFAEPVDPVSALAALDARYPDTYRFLIQPADAHAFFGASPELIADVEYGTLSTAALAGSRPRGATPDDDTRLGQELLDSPKERKEHRLVVEALRTRIAPYADALDIPAEPAIMRLKNIQHLYTPVRAPLHSRYGVLDLVNELHPTPALGGSPSYAAQRLIGDLESVERGWYAAPVGWVDCQGDGMFAVAIRSAVAIGSTARLYAGAGIVAESDPDAEWRETAVKFKPLMEALGVTVPPSPPQGASAHERAQS